jgi:hypothetical protein
MKLRMLVLAAVVCCVTAATGACSGNHSKAVGPSTPSRIVNSASTAPPTASPKPVIDPQAQPAVAAFNHYLTATFNSQMKPRHLGQAYQTAADFTKWAFDPMLGEENAYIGYLAAQGQAFRGTPPRPRLSVSQMSTTAKPYPTVVLSNCPTPSPSWVAYQVVTGKAIPYTQPKVKPPYRSEVVVIYHQRHWGVQKTTVDSSKTWGG